jgi:hypothetical protein
VGLLSRLFTRQELAVGPTPKIAVPNADDATAKLYHGKETLEVVGESFHQDVLWNLVGGRTAEHVRCRIRAELRPEPDNPVDSNAVMVIIDGEQVGHLSRDDAAAYLPGLRQLLAGGAVELLGVIVGGGRRPDGLGRLGVFLDHDPQDFHLPRTGDRAAGFRTGFSEAAATDLADDSYDLSWYQQLYEDDAMAITQLRRMLEDERDPIDRHYMMSALEKRLYKSREFVASALDEFDAACRDHHAEMVTIRAALLAKFGVVPLIETYRQAAIRCQKAKDWATMREWAERGISIYGENAGRPDAVEDLHTRLAYAVAKIEGSAMPKPRNRKASEPKGAEIVIETLVCSQCGETFERVRARGRKPHLCPSCRGS